MPRQTARGATAPGGRRPPGRPETHGRRRKVQALRRGDQGRSGAHDGRRRAPAGRTGLAPVAPSAPEPAEHVQRRSAAVPSCWWAGIWKRFHMVHCGRPGTGARARTAVGTHSRGTWIDFRLIFNSVAGIESARSVAPRRIRGCSGAHESGLLWCSGAYSRLWKRPRTSES